MNNKKIIDKYLHTGWWDNTAVEREEAELLYGLVRALKPGIVVEVGTYRGYSAAYIGQALRDNREGFLLTFDIEERGQTEILIGEFELIYYVRPMLANLDFLESIKSSIDMVFFDGDKNRVIDDYGIVQPHLSPHCTLLFHDTITNPKVMEDIHFIRPLGKFSMAELYTARGMGVLTR